MLDKRSLFAGMIIGAGVALAIREGVRLITGRRGGWHLDNWHGDMHDHPERIRTTHSVLEPEDSRTESHVPNAVQEDDSWMEARNKPRGRRRFGVVQKSGLDQQRMSRNAQRVADERDPDERVTQGSSGGRPQPGGEPAVESGSRTTTSTEAELRRTGTDDNPVSYTRPTDAQAASGGEAPFISEDK